MPCSDKPMLVTVGVPTYNRPAGLRRTLECMLAQTYPHLEIIISDNCSPDPAIGEISRDFQSRDSRVRYILQKENIGAARNFFHLAEQASGDYFMWAADDDWWTPDFIAVSARLLDEHPGAVVALTNFALLPESLKPGLRLPAYFERIREIPNADPAKRMMNYIRQKEVYGKAHIAYGLFRTSAIRQSIRQTTDLINLHNTVETFPQIDVLMNGVTLSLGDMVTHDLCLRKFSYGPRKGPVRPNRTFAERILKYDHRTIDYLNCFLPLIEGMPVGARAKAQLRKAVSRRKTNFILERIARRLFVYKIYWHFKKRLSFKPASV